MNSIKFYHKKIIMNSIEKIVEWYIKTKINLIHSSLKSLQDSKTNYNGIDKLKERRNRGDKSIVRTEKN